MANGIPEDWFSQEMSLFNDLIGGDYGAFTDPELQTLFDRAMFDNTVTGDERDAAYDALVEYLWEEYEIDFDDMFDWEDYREWYDTQ